MLKADQEHFDKHGEALFSSHMLDLSEEPDEENIAICAESKARKPCCVRSREARLPVVIRFSWLQSKLLKCFEVRVLFEYVHHSLAVVIPWSLLNLPVL